MRQTLIRVSLEHPWSFSPVEGLAGIGAGWLWLLLGACGLAWTLWSQKGRLTREQIPSGGIWGALLLAIITAPNWAPIKWFPVYGYGFMLCLGFLAAIGYSSRKATQHQLPPNTISDLAMWILVGGIAGARIFYLVQYHERVFAGKTGLALLGAALNLSQGGLVFYGGMILATIAFFVFCYRKNIPPLLMADLIAPAVFIGLAFGRIGCFLNGCCWGGACELPWAVTFPAGSVPYMQLVQQGTLSPDAAATYGLHPTQIYSSLNAALLAVLTACYFPRRFKNGAVLALAAITYPITRFLLEILRNDEAGRFGTDLTISQWVSVAMLIFGIALAVYLKTQPRESAAQSPAT